MINFFEVLEGWRNDLFPPDKLKEIINRVSEERLAICRDCEGYDDTGKGCSVPGTNPCCNKNIVILNGIKGCGCPLNKKTKCLSCKCPVNKWKAVLTEEQEEKFKSKIDGEDQNS